MLSATSQDFATDERRPDADEPAAEVSPEDTQLTSSGEDTQPPSAGGDTQPPSAGGDTQPPSAGGDAELRQQLQTLREENAELRASLLRWRVAAVAKWAETAADAMATATEVKELKRDLHASEVARLDINERHHQLNQLHHQLNERYVKMSRRYGNINRISEVSRAGLKRRLRRAIGFGPK